MLKPMKIGSKLPQVGVTIFAEMSKLANDHKAINLSQGFPDFDTHDALTVSFPQRFVRSDADHAHATDEDVCFSDIDWPLLGDSLLGLEAPLTPRTPPPRSARC